LNHLCVGVEPNNASEEASEPQGNRPWSTADVKQSGAAV
jgi:hypothetical protein